MCPLCLSLPPPLSPSLPSLPSLPPSSPSLVGTWMRRTRDVIRWHLPLRRVGALGLRSSFGRASSSIFGAAGFRRPPSQSRPRSRPLTLEQRYVSISYTSRTLVFWTFLMLVLIHWFCCVWGLMGQEQGTQRTAALEAFRLSTFEGAAALHRELAARPVGIGGSGGGGTSDTVNAYASAAEDVSDIQNCYLGPRSCLVRAPPAPACARIFLSRTNTADICHHAARTFSVSALCSSTTCGRLAHPPTACHVCVR